MQATRILLIRHGETAWNVAGKVQGHLDEPLNATGREQARRLAASLADLEALDAIYSSDLCRALQTAQAVADGMDLPVHPEAALRERSFGRFQGLRFDEVRQQWPAEAERWRRRDPDWKAPQGGESLLDLRQRILMAVNVLSQRHLGQHIGIFTHGGVLDILYRAATGLELQAARTWQLRNAAINRLLWTPDSGLTLVGWADARHLSDALDEKL